jgi:hypothetical protein
MRGPVTSFLYLRYRLQSFKIGVDIPHQDKIIFVISWPMSGANMGEIVRFVPKSERERARLIREARAVYDSVFPSADPVSKEQNKTPAGLAVGGANAHRSDGVVVS